MPLFTPQSAAIMARKRWDAEREAKLQPRILPAPCEANADEAPEQTEKSRTREHIDLLNQQLDSCTDPDEWDSLTRAKERLFRIWARLAQLPMDPKPGRSSGPTRPSISPAVPSTPTPESKSSTSGPGPGQNPQ